MNSNGWTAAHLAAREDPAKVKRIKKAGNTGFFNSLFLSRKNDSGQNLDAVKSRQERSGKNDLFGRC